ncbi:MAG: heme exporter protein CcmB [Acidobacteriota bacterium]|jgi:heme exporter protein B
MIYLRRAGRMALKDLRLEFRTGEKLSSMAFFAVLLVVVLHFAFDFSQMEFEDVGIGVLWVSVTFAGIVGLGHSFVVEREDGCLMGLLLCPGDRSAVYLGKFLSNLVFVLLVEALVLLLSAFLFNFSLGPVILPLAGVMLLYTLGFVALGTFLSAMSARTRRGEFLLTILLFPLIIPVILSSVGAAGGIIEGRPLEEIRLSLVFNGVYDLIMLVLALLFFEYVVEE